MPDSTNTGGRKPRVTDADLVDVFRSTTDPVLSTAEVADAVPIKRRGTLNRLRDLEDAGRLASKQIGGRNTVWWLLDDAVEGGVRGSIETSLADPVDEESDEDPEDPLDAALKGWSYGHALDAREANQIIARRSLAWLATVPTEPVKQSDVPLDELASVDPEERKAGSLWRTLIRDEAWKHAKEQGYVEEPKSGKYEWIGPAVEWDGEIDDPIDLDGDDVQTDSGVYDPTEEF